MKEELQKLIREWRDEPRTLQRSETALESWAFGFAARELEAAIRPQWVPVTKRLPEHDLWDVITWGGNEMHVAFRQDGRWVRSDGFVLRDVTHWHAIDYPEPPKVQ